MSNHSIFIRQGGALKRLSLEKIIVLEAADNYTRFIESGKFYTARISLDAALAQLPEGRFIRIHRTFAVAIEHIEEVGKDMVVLGGIAFPLSKKYYADVIKQLPVIEAV